MTDATNANLASYATPSPASPNRTHDEPMRAWCCPFDFDRHRVIASAGFRRLDGKTQVFAPDDHDHFRTRLTHTIEVAHLARCLAASLRANESLAEVISLAHDLGHPPFGHAGEAALDQAMAGQGGFNHNTHSLRVVTYLEHPIPQFRGLNLTDETLAGLADHTTRYDRPLAEGTPGPDRPSVEAQIASVADRIAYDTHDLEDAVGAGFVTLDDLANVALWQQAFESVAAQHSVKHIHAIRRAVIDKMLDVALQDIQSESARRLAAVHSPHAVRLSAEVLVAPSSPMDALLIQLEHFLRDRVYQRPEIVEADSDARGRVVDLFSAYGTDPLALPDRLRRRVDQDGLDRVICDYIAGMTDRFCTRQHHTLCRA